MSILNESNSLIIYDDIASSNNPLQRFVDWRKPLVNVTVSNPLNQRYTIAPGASQVLFDGTRTTLIDGTTNFAITLNPTSAVLYRITATSGQVPGFRTNRGLTLSGANITVAVNNNATATFTTSTGTFGTTIVGDWMFIPSTLTGDSGPFNVLNGGFWVVIAKTNTVLTVVRPPGVSFEAVAETVALTSNSQLVTFTSSGVQVGDTLEISAGFSSVTQKSYIVSSVTPTWVEFTSTVSLPLESGIVPNNAGLTFYSSAKRFVRIETDQEAVVRFNGDTSNYVRLSPRTVGDIKSGFAYLETWGTYWSMTIVNRSVSSDINVILISAE